MTYSIIGAGAIGGALARHFARLDLPVLIANARGPEALRDMQEALGASVQPVDLQTAVQADVVILALPFAAVPEIAAAGDWNGRLVIDATNAIDFSDFTPADLGGRFSSQIVAETLPGARIVKGFNTLPAAVLARDPVTAGGRRTIFLSSDDQDAAARAGALVKQLQFEPIFLGRIDEGGRLQQFGGALMVHSLLLEAA
ncbi:NADPH-dependent F420 reductase [Sphingomonas sp. OTU376]|uniref:NADPH-dependent F420 reductase n=1 Tax=Sphingomonas sp. OTU376 TaxID=3043863 RepID=UPI00313E7A2C